MIDCSLSCVIAAALLGSMVYMLFNYDKNNKILYFMSLLNPEQQEIYKNISKERLNIYLQGWTLGLILGLIYLNSEIINLEDKISSYLQIQLF